MQRQLGSIAVDSVLSMGAARLAADFDPPRAQGHFPAELEV